MSSCNAKVDSGANSVMLTLCCCLITVIATVSMVASDPKTQRTDWLIRATRARQLTWSSRLVSCQTDLPRLDMPRSEAFFRTHMNPSHYHLASQTSSSLNPNVASNPASHKYLGSLGLAPRRMSTCRSRPHTSSHNILSRFGACGLEHLVLQAAEGYPWRL